MGWLAALRRWRRDRLLARIELDDAAWRDAVERYPYTRVLSAADSGRLQALVKLFLHEKGIHGAGGLAGSGGMRVAIAVQACILVLELGLDYYRGWSEVIVYPDEFVARYEYVDDAGVVHEVAEPMTGEAWERGPVILSWADVSGAYGDETYNVVIHEFAHKLDMLNGEPNGFPPLHAGMSREAWTEAFKAAYDDFCARIDAREELPIDEYAAESPSEFFAVMSEVFFEHPRLLVDRYPAVYRELARFYRQDTLGRLEKARRAAAEVAVAGP